MNSPQHLSLLEISSGTLILLSNPARRKAHTKQGSSPPGESDSDIPKWVIGDSPEHVHQLGPVPTHTQASQTRE